VLDVQQGDQIRFTIREQSYPNHSVNVDELNIHSGDLVLFDTYTTPPLNKPGTYRLYCRAHTDRGHITKLVIHAAAATTSTTAVRHTTTSVAGRASSSTTASSLTSSTTVVVASAGGGPAAPDDGPAGPTATTAEPLVPVGRGTTSDRRRAAPEPGSLAALIGRRPGASGPWTRALRLGLASTAFVFLVAVGALTYGYRDWRSASDRS